MKKLIFLATVIFLFSGLSLMANKTTVTVKGPASAKKGTEVTIIIDVNHKGNSKMHYTDWVTLKFNGKEVKKWEFTKEKLPEAQDFKLEFKMVLTEDGTFEAQGHCNLHGSTGAKTLSIKTN